MKKIILFTTLSIALLHYNARAQEALNFQTALTDTVFKSGDNEAFKLKVKGMIRNDITYDTRQTVDFREGGVMFFAKDRLLDKNGADINAANQFHMLSIYSRVAFVFRAPDALGAKINGNLECDFLGSAEAGINELRIRHAWVTLDWPKSRLSIGQYWHPMTIVEMLPNVHSFTGGAPYVPTNRNPQVRYNHQLFNKLNVQVTAMSQRDFTLNTLPYRNSGMPALNGNITYKNKAFLGGVSAQFENLKPQLQSTVDNLKSSARVTSFSYMAFAKLSTKPLTIRAEAIYAQNAASFLMLGGFVGVKDPGIVEQYHTINTRSYWIDITSNYQKLRPGIFIGYSKNKGTQTFDYNNNTNLTAYGIMNTLNAINVSGNDKNSIDHIIRIAPRVEMNFKQLKFGFEPEYSVAAYGKATAFGNTEGMLHKIENFRFLFTSSLTF